MAKMMSIKSKLTADLVLKQMHAKKTEKDHSHDCNGPSHDQFSLEAVLADRYTADMQFEAAVVCSITDKKETSNIISVLNDTFRLKWPHLKRVARDPSHDQCLSVLICAAGETTCPPSLATLFRDKQLVPAGLGEPTVVHVPMTKPITRKQYTSCTDRWPTYFHEDKQIEIALRGEMFSALELQMVATHMNTILDKENTNTKSDQRVPVAASIVDPSTDRLLAVTVDRQHRHPLQHAVMVAIDLVARRQGGGTWPLDDAELSAVKECEASDSDSYLCTGFDVYVTHEPCVMCAMALVHSRIRRIIYMHTTQGGALGSQYKLHAQDALNSHYKVFCYKSPETVTLQCIACAM